MATFTSLRDAAIAKQRAAAQIIADACKVAAAAIPSRRIPGSIRVIQTGAQRFSIVAGGDQAPNAYPFETGARHPVFGMTGDGRPGDRTPPGKKGIWRAQPKRPFLEEGAAAGISKATDTFATFIDDVCDALDLDCY